MFDNGIMKHLLFLDIETTGLNPERAELIELSAIRVSADFTEELATFDELVKPLEEIPPFITRLTGISNEMVSDAPSIEKVHEDFKEFLRPSDVICGHNIQFDIGFLQKKGFSVPNESLDTFPLSSVLLPDEPSYSLEVLTQKYNIDHQNAHRALADVQANIGLFLELKKAAEGLPEELKEQYRELLEKSDWTGSILFDRAFSKGEKQRKKKSDDQVSLFDAPIAEEVSDEQKSDNNNESAPTLQEEKVAQKIEQFLLHEKKSLLSVGPEVREQTASAKALERISGSVFLALPKAHKHQTPEGFFRYSAPEKVICSTAFANWKQKQSALSEAEVVTAMKVAREKHMGSPMIFTDLPLLREEWGIAKMWLSDDHVRCPSDCPAKKMELDSKSQSRFFCEVSDTGDVPAKKGVILQGSRMAKELDFASRTSFWLKPLEKWAEEIGTTEKNLSDALLFGIGLLKRYVRERTGESPFRKYLVLTNDILETQEIKNLTEGFTETKKTACGAFPDEQGVQRDFQEIIDFIQLPVEENECRFITIHPDDALNCTRAGISLTPEFELLFGEKENIVFTGKAFLQKGGKSVFGEGLPVIEPQEEMESRFDYQNHSFFSIPEFGGNNKISDPQSTLQIAEELLPILKKNLLVLFPGSGLAETFCTGIAESAEKNGFQVLTIHGSAGKIAEQLKKGKSVLVATSSNWQKIDFSTANIEGCVQHRLLFDPPPDPPQQARIDDSVDEFLDIALPKAIQKVKYLLGGLTAGDHPFFWLLLDSHFQKTGGFTDAILSALPADLPVRKMGVPDMPQEVKGFLAL
jgi:DNA polymerase III epsilon subunit-like protein